MKREELLFGALIYALVIAAGYSGPILEKLKKLNWNEPVRAVVHGGIKNLEPRKTPFSSPRKGSYEEEPSKG